MEDNEFNMKIIMKRMIDETENKIKNIRRPNPNEDYQVTKKGFFMNEKYCKGFPVSLNTYNKYSAFANNAKASKKYDSIDLRNFYDFCVYNNCSADYFLGFNNTKRKEPSAQRVQKDFGLSDKAMNTLSIIKKNKPEAKGELSSDIVNMILENQDFWQKLNDRLPVYLSNANYSRADIDVDVARYALIRVFEELIDDICSKLENDRLPYEELDNTGIFSL